MGLPTSHQHSPATDHAVSVILVREWEQQLSGSGCCGRLQGDLLNLNSGQPIFAERRAIMEGMGPLYRMIRATFGERVNLEVIDPRNQIALIPRLCLDFWRYRVDSRGVWRSLSGLSTSTVYVNGRLFSAGPWPDPEALKTHLLSLLNREITEIGDIEA